MNISINPTSGKKTYTFTLESPFKSVEDFKTRFPIVKEKLERNNTILWWVIREAQITPSGKTEIFVKWTLSYESMM